MSTKTVRLTMAQAMVRYLSAQFTEVDGQDNQVFGERNFVDGDQNQMVGYENAVYGRVNKIIGMRNGVAGREPMANQWISFKRSSIRSVTIQIRVD